ncbi:MAG: FkbM family methyltransferase [Thermonemataceae bacterium]
MRTFLRKTFAKQLYGRAYSRAYLQNLLLIWQELKVLMTQFFTWRAPFQALLHIGKNLSLTLNRFYTGRAVFQSYGHTGEDRIIESLLNKPHTDVGFYVDVGANHPSFISNTFLLYRRGWRGICIEANPRLVNLHKKKRPKDIVVQAVVSDKIEEVTFTTFTNDVLSTVDETHMAEALQQPAQQIQHQQIHTSQLLIDLLDKNDCPQTFDLLCIDIEGKDLAVVESFDFTRYQPRLLVFEAEGLSIEFFLTHQLYYKLAEHKYHFAGAALKNFYFIKK